jgi:hypothetical protein
MSKKMRSTRKRVRSAKGKNDVDSDIQRIARHISDPCNSDLSSSGLPGQKGFVSRFVEEIECIVPANEACVVGYWPGASSFSKHTGAIGFSYTPNILANGGPGTNFLGTSSAVASSFRPLGVCFEIMNYTRTINRGGMWAVINMPVKGFTGVATTPARLQSASNERGTFGDGRPIQALWRPGLADDTYGVWNDANNEFKDQTDSTALVTVLSAGDAEQTIRLRMVLVCEWVPKIGETANGLIVPTAGASTHNIRSSQVVAALDKQRPGWWCSAIQSLGKLAIAGFNQAMVSQGLPGLLLK